MKKRVPILGKKDNFYGDRSIVLSEKQLHFVKHNPKLGGLYLTCAGFYPHAKNHFRKRTSGIDEHILIYCIFGYGYVEIEGKVHKLSSGAFFIIRADTPHAYWAAEDFPWSIYWIHFSGNRCEYLKSRFRKGPFIIPEQASRIDDRADLFNEILTVLESGFRNENLEFCNFLFGSLLASFLYPDTYRAAKGILGADPIDNAIFFMQDNLDKPLKIEGIAKHVNLSKSHLSRVFKSKTGSSPIDYFISLKMQEAIRLLSNQSLRINEVAYTLGYLDPFYFSRLFKKHIGVSPRVFLKMKYR